jgi:hypothetical protein
MAFNSGSHTTTGKIQYTASIGQVFLASSTLNQQDALTSSVSYKVEKQSENKFIKVYPNPAGQILNFTNTNASINYLYIFDCNGKIVKQQNINTMESGTLDIENLARGIYFLRFISEKNSRINETIKLIKL